MAHINGQLNADGLAERTVLLIEAAGLEQVTEKAEVVIKELEPKYLNNCEELVEWKFVKILGIQDLFASKITDGMEVYSRLDYWSDIEDECRSKNKEVSE